VDRHQPAHARPTGGNPALVDVGPRGQPLGQEAQVVDHRRVQVTLRLAVTAVVEGQRDEAVARGRAGEVRMVLFARPGTVHHHHGGPRPLPRWLPQAPGDAREGSGFVRGLDV
jgi:hypothetical protein